MKTRRAMTRLQKQAGEFAIIFPRSSFHPRVIAWAESVSRRENWSVAFSGGADSLALLLLIWAHWPERRARVRVLHFDHRMRGAASKADAMFCRNVCAKLGVTLIEAAWQEARKGASEAEARAVRLKFFEKKSRVLFLGQQQDDIAETMLMRIARGSGTSGLAAPRPIQPMPGGRTHLRPLLTLKKSELSAALWKVGIVWREDASNGSDNFFRNRVRRSVLPTWVRVSGRDALAGAALARELLEEDDSALEQWLEELRPFTSGGGLDLKKLAGRPKALVRRALRLWLSRQKAVGELARQGFETLLTAVITRRTTQQSLGVNCFAVIDEAELILRCSPAVSRKPIRRFPRRAN